MVYFQVILIFLQEQNHYQGLVSNFESNDVVRTKIYAQHYASSNSPWILDHG